MNKTNIVCATLAIVMTSVVVPTAVSAKEPITVVGEANPTAVVSYADLNLNHEDGVKSLFGRVRRAATDLCIAPGVQPIASFLEGRACRDAAIAGAQSQVDQAINSLGRQNYAASQTIVVALR